MKIQIFKGAVAAVLCLWLAGLALAVQDNYIGDTAIYSSSSTYLEPNVLFVVDSSDNMYGVAGSFKPYDPAEDYATLITDQGLTPNYASNTVYVERSATGGTINYGSYIADVETVSCGNAYDGLTEGGAFIGRLKNNGTCTARQPGDFYLGNQLNYNEYVPDIPVWQAGTDYARGDQVAPSTPILDANGDPIAFTCDKAGRSGPTEPAWDATEYAVTLDDFNKGIGQDIQWVYYPGSSSLMEMAATVLKMVAQSVDGSVKMGLMRLGENNVGGHLVRPVKSVDSDSTDTDEVADYNSLITAIDGLKTLETDSPSATPVGQTMNTVLVDASTYFKGELGTAANRLGTNNASLVAADYASPIDYACQKNFVIVLTMGSTDNLAANIVSLIGDADNSGGAGNQVIGGVADAAKNLYETDHLGTTNRDIGGETVDIGDGAQRLQTSVVQLMTASNTDPANPDPLPMAANSSHGRGKYITVNNPKDLQRALQALMANIVRDADTSFVAPVVPTSPENRTYSGQRVYLGFFNPVSQKPWMGNVKKLGLDTYNQIVDSAGVAAINDDGSFNDGSISYWSVTGAPDAGIVEQGGAGGVLMARDIVPSVAANAMNTAADPRDIYTYLGSSTDLTDSGNAFDTDNAALTTTALGLDLLADPTGERDKLIRFIHGLDAYDDDNDELVGGNGVTNEKRGWLLGDVLHSKPQVVNYSSYSFSTANENDCSVNKAMIYVGGNDGMMHAFRDCDGRESWAFVPPEVLPGLQDLTDVYHAYYVDGSPRIYKYDHDHDGNIEPADGDKAILIFGLRRGGRAYYALDVSDPASPVYLWEINETHVTDLGQTWSQPVFGKVQTDEGSGPVDKIVAFVGAGYDNDSEDRRIGLQYSYPADITEPIDNAEGAVSSSYALGTTPYSRMGRGVFAFEVATLDSSGVPTVSTSVNIVWQCTFSDQTISFTYPGGTYPKGYLQYHSFPSDVAALDIDFDGYTDRLYVGDTGGWMWRFAKQGTDSTAADYFKASTSRLIDDWWGSLVWHTGQHYRKIFFPPSVTYEAGGQVNLYFGSGDRAHPLNEAFTDYIYAFKDKNIGGVANPYKYPGNMLNFTSNELQAEGTTTATITSLLTTLHSSSNYGWYIGLGSGGEKVLADSLAFNKVAYYTTYDPNAAATTNPCLPGNLGESRLYAVDYQTGEAVFNFDEYNDDVENNTNIRAGGDGYVLRKTDRSLSLGVGIPSGLVLIINASGDPEVLIGCGGGVCTPPVNPGGTLYPVYWLPY